MGKQNLMKIVATAQTASPQLENGYTSFANELIDKIIQFPFTSRQLKIMLAIMRKTYGYHKTHTYLRNEYICKMTDLEKSAVSKTLKQLKNMDCIIDYHKKDPSFSEGELGIQKDYFRWNKTVVKTTTELSKQQQKVVKTTTIKERKKTNKYSEDFSEFWSVYPKKKDKHEAYKKYIQARKEYSAEFILETTKRFALDVDLENTEQQFIKHAKTFLHQRQFEDYEDLTEEQIRSKHTLTKKDKPDNRPQWAKDKDLLDEQNEKRVATHWQIEKKEETVYVTSSDKKQKNKAMFDKLASKHNFK